MSMRLAYRSRPGIPSPSRKAAIAAVCLASAAGFYGFATSVQKAATLRTAAGAGSAITDDQARAAMPVAPTPSLVYAVTDGQPTDAPTAPRPATLAAAEKAPANEEDVSLIAQSADEKPAAPLEVATAGPLVVPPVVTPAEQPIVIPPAEPPATSLPTP